MNDHPLLRQMLSMQDPLLIQMKANSTHQCNLVSRQGNRRYVISLSCPARQYGFSLA